MTLLPLEEDIALFNFPEQITGIKKVEEVIYHLLPCKDRSTGLFLLYTEERVFCWNDRSKEIVAQADTPEEVIEKIFDLFEQEKYLARIMEIIEDYKEKNTL